MKFRTKIVIICLMVGSLIASSLLLYKHSLANSAPLTTAIDVNGDVNTLHDIDGISGRSLYTSDLIQPGPSWTVSLDYTPLNGSASVLVLSANGSILDIQKGNSSGGNLTFTESISQPVRLSVYASSWHLTVR